MRAFQLVLILLLCIQCTNNTSKKEDIAAIRSVMNSQAKAWSNHDIKGFMEGYHKSDSVTYFGSNGIKKGYQAMLDGYLERYPTKAHTGTLEFTLHDITKIDHDAYWVMGEYHLIREMGNANGTFMVVLKRIDGEWKIIGDSSC